MIDIGPNLCNKQFDNDLANVIDRAVNNNILGLILTSTDLLTYKKNLSIIETYKNLINIKTTYGLHPHNANQHQSFFPDIKKCLTNYEVCAIGEFGLDYFRMISPKDIQIYVMEKFLAEAKFFPNLPLFLHERESFEDFYHIIKNSNHLNKSVVHCFTGNTHELKSYLDLNCFIGITGWISDKRRNNDLVDAVRYLPLDKLMIETDCPYLTPKNLPTKQFRNEPAFLPYVAQSIAEIKQISVKEVIEVTTKNSFDFFSIKNYDNKKKNTLG